MVPIYAELSAGGETIVLVAGGTGGAEEVAQSAKRLQTLTPLFSKSDPPGALTVPTSWPAVVQLSATFGDYWQPQPNLKAWILEETLRRTEPLAGALDHLVLGALPSQLAPRPYQSAGALEIARTGRALIFDEPRTGKTITTILGLAQRAAERSPEMLHGLPVLVVCPASVVDPWVDAFNTWAPYWQAVAWRGSKRHDLAETADVYVTSYDTARADATVVRGFQSLIKLGAKTLVVDESHYIKNQQAERTKAVRRLARNADQFVALSGTPITKHTGDLWPVLDCLFPGAFPARERFVKYHCLSVQGDYDEEILGLHPHTEAQFRISILGQHRRVARADVMPDLPPKVYSVRTVQLPKDWRKTYDDFENQMFAELPDGQELAVMDVLSTFTHLSGLASAAADVEITYGPDVYADNHPQAGEEKRHVRLHLKAPSWKVDALLEILDERCGQDIERADRDAVVAFAPSKQLIMLAGAAAAKAGYRVGYVVGDQSGPERTAAIKAFQDGELDVICCTTGAGGTGITLSRAGTIVFLQRPWKLTESLQSEDRAEGDMEATRGTEIIDIVASNTLDSRVRAVLRERAGQLADLVQDPRIVAELLGGTRSKERAA